MRTTLTLEDDVAARLERLRKARKQSFKDIVNEALRTGLREMDRPSRSPAPFRTRTVDLGRCLMGAIDDIADVLAVADGESFR